MSLAHHLLLHSPGDIPRDPVDPAQGGHGQLEQGAPEGRQDPQSTPLGSRGDDDSYDYGNQHPDATKDEK